MRALVLAVVYLAVPMAALAQSANFPLVPSDFLGSVRLTRISSSGVPRNPANSEAIPCAFGATTPQYRIETWANLTGKTLTLTGANLWFGADGGGNIYDIGTSLLRRSDGSSVIFNNHDRYGPNTGLTDRFYPQPPNFTLVHGDALVYTSWCYAYGWSGNNGAVAVSVQYTW